MTNEKTGSIEVDFKEAFKVVEWLIDTLGAVPEEFEESGDIETLKPLVEVIDKLMRGFPSIKDSLDGGRLESWKNLKILAEAGQLPHKKVSSSIEIPVRKIPKETIKELESKTAEQIADEIFNKIEEVFPEHRTMEGIREMRYEVFHDIFEIFLGGKGIPSEYELPPELRVKMKRAEIMARAKLASQESLSSKGTTIIPEGAIKELESKTVEDLTEEIIKKVEEIFPEYKTRGGSSEMGYVFRDIFEIFLRGKGIKSEYDLDPELRIKMRRVKIKVREKLSQEVSLERGEIQGEVLNSIQEVAMKYQEVPIEKLVEKIIELEKDKIRKQSYESLRTPISWSYFHDIVIDYFKGKEGIDISPIYRAITQKSSLLEFKEKLYSVEEILRKKIPKIKSEIEQEKRKEKLETLETEFWEWAKAQGVNKTRRITQKSVDLFLATRERPMPREIYGLLYEKLRLARTSKHGAP